MADMDPIHSNSFQGGTSVSKKLAVASGYYYSEALDNRTDPSQLSILPAPSTIPSGINDLITAMDQDLNGVRWGVGANGGVYKIDTSNVISKAMQLPSNGAAGILYNQVTDQLYIPSQESVSMYGQVTTGITGNPQPRKAQFAHSGSVANGCVNLFSASQADALIYGGSGTGYFDGYARNNVQSIGVGITEEIIAENQVVSNTTAANNPATPGTAQSYTLPNTLSETAGNYCYFAPDTEPFYSIFVYVTTVGTGNWALTLHDSLNNQLAQVTVPNASMKANTYNEFKFGSQIRALINSSQTGTSATYHFHLTSSVAGDTAAVGTIVASDLSTVDFILLAYRLVQTKNGWHPTALFTGSGQPLLCIGNGQYLSTYNFGNDSNPTNFQWGRHTLIFKQGYEVCGLTTYQQYLVIAVERRSSNPNRNQQDGALYLWSGTTTAPDIFIDITMGSPYGIYNHNGVVYFSVDGSLFAYAGGQTVIKARKQAFYQNTDYLGTTDSTIVNPNMMCSRYNLLMSGFPSSTTNSQINYGIYSWGTVELTFPNSYVLSYLLANQIVNNNVNGITNLQIGSVYNFVDSMYISWSYTQNSITYYGLDILNNSSVSAPYYLWQSLIWDGGVSYKTKLAKRIKVTCRALPTGQTLQAGYSLDGGAWVWSPSVTTGAVGETIDVNKRFHEIQYGFQGTTTGITDPAPIIGATLDVDPLEDEDNMTATL